MEATSKLKFTFTQEGVQRCLLETVLCTHFEIVWHLTRNLHLTGKRLASKNAESSSVDLRGKRFQSAGSLEYSVHEGYYRCVVNVDPELTRYLRSLVPKYYICKPQKYAPHITVVRGETPPRTDEWALFQGEIVQFEYESYLHYDGTYWWINCWSPRLTEVRIGLNLPPSYHLTRPPDGSECFHSTVGNSKK